MMSETNSAPVAPVPPVQPIGTFPPPNMGDVWWTKPAMAFVNKGIFLIFLLAALWLKLESVIMFLAGIVATMAANPDKYYWGSSEGSRNKDATIAVSTPPTQIQGPIT